MSVLRIIPQDFIEFRLREAQKDLEKVKQELEKAQAEVKHWENLYAYINLTSALDK